MAHQYYQVGRQIVFASVRVGNGYVTPSISDQTTQSVTCLKTQVDISVITLILLSFLYAYSHLHHLCQAICLFWVIKGCIMKIY